MKKIAVIFSLVLLMSSCLNDFLEIEPLNTVSTEIYWKTESDVRAALNAAYVPLKDAYKIGYLNWYEARSDNFIGSSGGTNPYQNVCFNKLTAALPSCNWNNWYKMISVANYAIYYIPKMDNVMAENTRNHLLSEAYFLRAYAYFNLYRIWGDVPLISNPVLKKSDVYKPERATKEKIMELVNGDLISATKLVDNSQTELYLYSPGALYALCTEVAMWNHDYDGAIDYSQRLYDLNVYTLEGTDFLKVCADPQTTDNIWTLKWSYVLDGANNIVTTYVNSGNLLVPTKEIIEKWQAWGGDEDIRLTATLDPTKITSYRDNHIIRMPVGCQMWKWSPGERLGETSYRECYIPIYRLADIVLLRAEALNRKGEYQDAIIEMNKVRRRAGLSEKTLSDYTGANGVDWVKIEDDILQERQFELFGEGKRWFDLMRTGRLESVMNTFYDGYITTYGGQEFIKYTEDWQKYWPVSQDILNENEKLVQTGNY